MTSHTASKPPEGQTTRHGRDLGRFGRSDEPSRPSAKPLIVLQDVGVRYRVPQERIPTFKEYAIRRLRGKVRYHSFWALQNINLEIYPGEVFGIIGPNGAGKSTLLKVIARVLYPTRGRVCINGRVAPLLELGAGFDPELTGRENIYLNGAILGYTKTQIDAIYPEIVSFSGLAEFINAPLRTYSSGMYARLGFSVATASRPDILIVDEILGVGDAEFQTKSYERLQSFKASGTTILLVSHSMGSVEEICTRAMWLDHGEVVSVDSARTVVLQYARRTMEKEAERLTAERQAAAQLASPGAEGRVEQTPLASPQTGGLPAGGLPAGGLPAGGFTAGSAGSQAEASTPGASQAASQPGTSQAASQATSQAASQPGASQAGASQAGASATASQTAATQAGVSQAAVSQTAAPPPAAPMPAAPATRWGTRGIEITGVHIKGSPESTVEQGIFETGQPFVLQIDYVAHKPITGAIFGMAIHRHDGVHITGPNTEQAGKKLPRLMGAGKIIFRITRLPLLEGLYHVSVAVVDEEDRETFDYHDRLYPFRVVNPDKEKVERYGMVTLNGHWEHERSKDG